MSSALACLPPPASRTGRRPVRSWLTSRIARIGLSSEKSRNATPASIISSTNDAEPTLSMVVDSLMLESPTMTCRRRYFSASACGSSRVLMIGRERVVALDTPPRCARPVATGRTSRLGGGLQHLACTTDELAGHQERQQHIGDTGELACAHDQVILVAAVGVARRIGVVLEQIDVTADAFVGEALFGVDEQVLEHPFTSAVVGDQLREAVTFGGRVLRVAAHVEVQARTVAEEDVAATPPRHDPPEQIARHFVGTEPAMAVERAGDTEFGLDAHDSSLHLIETTCCLRVRGRDGADEPLARRADDADEPLARRADDADSARSAGATFSVGGVGPVACG